MMIFVFIFFIKILSYKRGENKVSEEEE